MVKREAEGDASCCESNQKDTRSVSAGVAQQKGATQGHDRGKRLTLRSSLLRLGRDLGARICGCADGRVTRTRRTGIGYSQKMNNKRGFAEARRKMHVLGELLGWRRGGLQGLVVGMGSESKSRAEGWQRERAEQEQREPRASKTKKGFDVAVAATASKML